ncbi:MAG TPA: winged helix-turn-helix domain-containing protein [Jatrophihabitans sp.]|nr:winged helix-turn-helix domain-containing protein [Jatrophihabitans sp.]
MPPRQKKPQDRPPVKLTDPRAIRALAHPARLAVIDELYSGRRELTATECAEIAGLSPSAMSYHLRSLEKAGIVERADSAGDGRERPWRAAGSYLQVDSTGGGAGELAASAALSSTVLGRTVEQFDAYLARRRSEPREWLDAVEASYGQVWLLPEEAKAIGNEFVNAMAKYRGRRDARPLGARRMRLAMLLFPTDEPKQDT